MVATITPRPAIGLLAVAAAAYLWFTLTNSELRGRALLASGAFALIETVWTTLATTDTATGATRFRAPALGTLGHSSFTQFWANVLYTPLLLDGFRVVVPDHPAVRIALFPLNVWLLEVIEVRSRDSSWVAAPRLVMSHCPLSAPGVGRSTSACVGLAARDHATVNHSVLIQRGVGVAP